MNVLEKLGSEVTAAENRVLETYMEEACDLQGFLNDAMILNEPVRARRLHWKPVWAIGLAGLAASVALFTVLFWPKPVEQPRMLETPNRIVVSETERIFNFSNGSLVAFMPSTLGEINAPDDEHVAVILKKGKAQISVVHKPNTDWRVSAGPYTIAVTGTQFDVDWQEDSKIFRLALKEGSVKIDGPMLGVNGVLLESGRELVADLANERMEWYKLGEQRDESGSFQEEPVDDAESDSIVEDERSRKEKHPQKTMRKSVKKESYCKQFSSLVKQGDSKVAYKELNRIGSDTLIRRCQADTLFLIGDVGRLNGDTAVAKQAYLALRKRFGKNRLASIAALQLGRLEFDRLKRYDRAVHWLETYLREGSDRTLSREALGRLIEAASRSAQSGKATQAAQDYLRAYPSGPHAARARALLDK